MMNRYLCTTAVLMIFLVLSQPLTGLAQESVGTIRTDDNSSQFLMGVTAAGTVNQYSRGIPMAFQAVCSVLEEGVGVGFSGGLAMEYLLNRELSITSHARFGSHPGYFERIEPIGRTQTTENGPPARVIITILSDINYQILEADFLLKWSPMRFGPRNAIGFAVGPSIGYVLEGTMSQDQHIKIFDNDRLVREEDIVEQVSSERKRSLTEGEDIEGLQEFRMAIRGGVFVNYQIHPAIALVPGFYMDYSLNTVTERPFGNLDIIHLQLDLLIAI